MNIIDEAIESAYSGDIAKVHRLVRQVPGLLHARRDDQDMIIHSACYGRHVELVEWLLIQGVDPNAIGNFGYTPLHFSVYYGDEKSANLVRLLLKFGSDPDIEDCFGFTPAELAKARHGRRPI